MAKNTHFQAVFDHFGPLISLGQGWTAPLKLNFAYIHVIYAKVWGLIVGIAKILHFSIKMPVFCQFSYVLMVFNLYLPHISGKIMSEIIVLSIFSKGNVRIDKKKNYNDKYEIVLYTPHFNARWGGGGEAGYGQRPYFCAF